MVAQRTYILGGTRSIEALARSLELSVARPVVDDTALTGNFDINLQWKPTEFDPPGGAVADADNLPSLFTAIQEQLGLRLEPSVGPIEVLVIESVERPTSD